MCVIDHHDMTLALKVALTPNTINTINYNYKKLVPVCIGKREDCSLNGCATRDYIFIQIKSSARVTIMVDVFSLMGTARNGLRRIDSFLKV